MTKREAEKILRKENISWSNYFDLKEIFNHDPCSEVVNAAQRLMLFVTKGI